LAINRNFSFAAISIVVALLIPLCMDYALTPAELILFISLLFLMFFRNSIYPKSNPMH